MSEMDRTTLAARLRHLLEHEGEPPTPLTRLFRDERELLRQAADALDAPGPTCATCWFYKRDDTMTRPYCAAVGVFAGDGIIWRLQIISAARSTSRPRPRARRSAR